MKEITVKIPDKKVDFFMELIDQLGITISREVEIPEEQKIIVRDRIKKTNKNPERLIDWSKVHNKFKFD
ncbi:MAG: hypothetical protein AUK34_05115 [Ignavibacteria bacterium CG2_30_36_16]|nr:hypothetical protein [Ignavibacteria bacterium]OIP61335.1 MAG: hypothetical protein AUK34_05115 [Ignavibacteria bacterium CG2_30_36_16]PJB02420.1 MAG: hypothetical protein CO127_00175 [Ignavibacteria bacterium CG_4_9_14_3_um_filter_36_18]